MIFLRALNRLWLGRHREYFAIEVLHPLELLLRRAISAATATYPKYISTFAPVPRTRIGIVTAERIV